MHRSFPLQTASSNACFIIVMQEARRGLQCIATSRIMLLYNKISRSSNGLQLVAKAKGSISNLSALDQKSTSLSDIMSHHNLLCDSSVKL